MPEINNMFGAIRNASLKFYLENVQGLEYLDMDVYYQIIKIIFNACNARM